jgi:hypothetical protein
MDGDRLIVRPLIITTQHNITSMNCGCVKDTGDGIGGLLQATIPTEFHTLL